MVGRWRFAALFSDKETYKALDIVALNGGSFIAKKDNPGPCPGAGWQLIASQGKRGDKGERGLQGIPGVPVFIAEVAARPRQLHRGAGHVGRSRRPAAGAALAV